MVCDFLAIVMLFFAYGKGNMACLVLASIFSLLGFFETYVYSKYGEGKIFGNKNLILGCNIVNAVCVLMSLIRWGIVAFS